MNNNKNDGLAVRGLGIGRHKYLGLVAASGWPEAGDGFSAILWVNWLNRQWSTQASPERRATLKILRDLALGELEVFQRRAETAPPACQVLCAGLAAEATSGETGYRAPGAWGLCDPALMYLPRVVGRGLAHPARPGDAGVEEGFVSMRALGQSSWHTGYIARRAVERGWHRIWVCGNSSFVSQLVEAAGRHGLAAQAYGGCCLQ